MNISNLATPEGRGAYQKYWQDLVVEQRNLVIPSLFRLWRTAVRGTSFNLSTAGESYRIAHPLGIRLGTRVFMEEIVVRHYFNNVQALVYLGAVLLLIFLALRFVNLLSEQVALVGIGIEVFMLLLLFVVLFYTPEEEIGGQSTIEQNENTASGTNEKEEDIHVIKEVLEELEDIGGSYASLGSKLEGLAKAQQTGLEELSKQVEQIRGLELLESHAERLDTTNTLLEQLVSTMNNMNRNVETLLGKELEYLVRRELERRISGSMNDGIASHETDVRKPVE